MTSVATDRTRTNRWIALFVLFQLAMPLTYYVRNDRYDERFAWRMFSGIRMEQCRTVAMEEDQNRRSSPIRLQQDIHVGWISQLRRNRRAVIWAFLDSRCKGATAPASVEVHNTCQSVHDERVIPSTYSMDCATGEKRLITPESEAER